MRLKRGKGDCHCTATLARKPGVSLRVVPVTVCGVNGPHEVQTYALLYDGLDVSPCVSSLVWQLRITCVPMAFSLMIVNERAKDQRSQRRRSQINPFRS